MVCVRVKLGASHGRMVIVADTARGAGIHFVTDIFAANIHQLFRKLRASGLSGVPNLGTPL
jgi:hypothetical protein